MNSLTIAELKKLIAPLPDHARLCITTPRDVEYFVDELFLSYTKPFDASKREFVNTEVKLVIHVK